MLRLFTILIGILFTLTNCSKEENHRPSADFTVEDCIDKFILLSSAKDEDGDELTYKWISTSELIFIYNSYLDEAYFRLPSIDEPTIINIKHIVCDGQSCDSVTKSIELPKLTKLRKMGLGIVLQKEHSNNVNYEWYIDQYATGYQNFANCGPTATTMAIKWAIPNFRKTVQDAKNAVNSNHPQGAWNFNMIIKYLQLNSINYYYAELTNTDSLVREIDKGNIIILGVDMYYIRLTEDPDWHIDNYFKLWNSGIGHAFVIKGYKIFDNQVLFEIYDPYSWNMRYRDDNMLIGKDRYYRASDINDATNHFIDYYIVVTKDVRKRTIDIDIDPDKFEQKYLLQ